MISVSELAAASSLGLRFRAGASGGHRLVTWAHAVDLPDPWRWVSAGNLVMTTGAGMPSDPDEQAAWLERLANTNASALVVARSEGSPAVTDALLAMADRRMFPVLEADFELEFVRLSRRVIENVLQGQKNRFEAGERLFQTYITALRERPDLPGRLDFLAAKLGVGLEIQDNATGMTVAGSGRPADQALAKERIWFSGRAKASLVVTRPDTGTLRDPMLTHALVGLLGIELERAMITRDEERRDGEALLRSLCAGETDIPAARTTLERRGLRGPLSCLVVSAGRDGDWTTADVHLAPGLERPAALFLQSDTLTVLVPDGGDHAERLCGFLGAGTHVGVSDPVSPVAGIGEALRQARLALSSARENGSAVVRYADVEFNPATGLRSLADARTLFARYLSPLADHDRKHGAQLVATLTAFLDNDANWKATAGILGIHRQTLVYRLKQVEQLTGLRPNSTLGIARFWSAIEASRTLGLQDT
ncbi:PucR family transcriptional regulator [Aureimonas ureilytica]|uniref:PucR family transcriptional regulator n=1 Tax=Aureimonas ureilytica TaxID=401562 RepID=UPI000363917D|nr:PucR family transcriptional regulator [Aureimonas ureilytica]